MDQPGKPAIIIADDIDDDINYLNVTSPCSEIGLSGIIPETLPVPPSQIQISLCTIAEETNLYRIPPKSSKCARKIWKKAGLSIAATPRQIELKLLEWALGNARLEIKDNVISKIYWQVYNGTICSGTWTSFIRWMLCATISNTVKI